MKTKFIVPILALASLSAMAEDATLRHGSSATLMPTATAETPFMVKPAGPDATVAANPMQKSVSKRAKAYDVPFIEDFSNPATLNDWGVVDNNNDGYTWQYDEKNQLVKFYTLYAYDRNNDWLVTPAINLGADDIYTLTFSVGTNCNRESIASEELTVTMGTNESVSKNTTVLFSDDNLRNFWNGKMRTVTVTLPVKEDGAYYICFHCTSPSASYCIYLDDIRIEQNGSHAAPAAPDDFNVVPGAKGALNATATMKAPATDAEGNPLKALDNIALYRNDLKVDEIINPTPGAVITLTDANPANGMHTYRAIATANGLEGSKAEASVWVGIDAPKEVTGVVATEQPDGSILLTWNTPLSVNGGYVDDDVLTYTVVRYDASTETTVGTITGQRTLTDRIEGSDAVQNHVYYSVTASSKAGTSKESLSNSVFTGPAYALPFAESFAECNLKKSPWVMETIKYGVYPTQWQLVAMGALPTCPPIDGDDGMAMFYSKMSTMNLFAGNEVRLATPAIELAGANDPQISFYIFHYDTTTYEQVYDEESEQYETVTNTYKESLRLQISVDNGEYVDIPDSRIMLAANNNGWTKYTISLVDYKNAKKASIGLVGYADGGGNIYVDQILVEDKVDADIAVESLLGPQCVEVGETAEYLCTIVNRGIASTKEYTVDLKVDGVTVDSKRGQGAAIFANGGEKLIRLSFTPGNEHSGTTHELTATVNFAADQCMANNTSDVIKLEVPSNGLPKVETLVGTSSDKQVSLSWEEPDFSDKCIAITDHIETYEPFAISNIGRYTLVDNDRASATYTVSGIGDYPNSTSAMAWQVFNPYMTTLDLELAFNRRWIPRSGNQYLMSWGADDSNVSSNDDWLISPLLSGESQTVSFWIKSITLAYEERFRVLYSTDTKSISDFVKVAETTYYRPNSSWRRFSVKLPAGAKYFAIQCISADGFGLMVDDISFIPEGTAATAFDFMGYRVYRDGELLTNEPLAEPEFIDNAPLAGVHNYTVSCLFAQGESAPSQPYATVTSSISAIESAAVPTIVPHIGCIEIAGYSGNVKVYDLAGRLVASHRVDGNLTFSIEAGAYIVRCGETIAKVAVK